MKFKGRLSDFREKRVCKQHNEGLNKFYIELIVFRYTPKITNIFDHSRLGLKKQIIPKQKNSVAHLYTTLVFCKVKGAMSPNTHARANENKLEKDGPTFLSCVGDFGRLFLSV